MKSKLGLIVLSALVLAGCTPASPTVQTRVMNQNDFTVSIPATWNALDNSWRKTNTVFAYGDSTGSTNRESLIVYHMVNVFRNGDKFDEQYCREYFRLSNVGHYYDKSDDNNVKLDNVVYDAKNGDVCAVYYTWKPQNSSQVSGVDYLVVKGTDMYVAEGTAVDGTNFDSAKQAALSLHVN